VAAATPPAINDAAARQPPTLARGAAATDVPAGGAAPTPPRRLRVWAPRPPPPPRAASAWHARPPKRSGYLPPHPPVVNRHAERAQPPPSPRPQPPWRQPPGGQRDHTGRTGGRGGRRGGGGGAGVSKPRMRAPGFSCRDCDRNVTGAARTVTFSGGVREANRGRLSRDSHRGFLSTFFWSCARRKFSRLDGVAARVGSPQPSPSRPRHSRLAPPPRPSLPAALSPAVSAAAWRPRAPPLSTRSDRLAAPPATSLAGLWQPSALPVTAIRAHESHADGRQ